MKRAIHVFGPNMLPGFNQIEKKTWVYLTDDGSVRLADPQHKTVVIPVFILTKGEIFNLDVYQTYQEALFRAIGDAADRLRKMLRTLDRCAAGVMDPPDNTAVWVFQQLPIVVISPVDEGRAALAVHMVFGFGMTSEQGRDERFGFEEDTRPLVEYRDLRFTNYEETSKVATEWVRNCLVGPVHLSGIEGDGSTRP